MTAPTGWLYRPWYQDGWRWEPQSALKSAASPAPTVNETAARSVVLYDAQGRALMRKRVAGFVETS